MRERERESKNESESEREKKEKERDCISQRETIKKDNRMMMIYRTSVISDYSNFTYYIYILCVSVRSKVPKSSRIIYEVQ